MIIRNILISIFVLLSCNVLAKKKYLNYSQSADVFELVDTLSREMGTNPEGVIYNYWIKEFKLSFEDKRQLNKFREIRLKYLKRNSEFDKFSLAFYKAQSVDGAISNLKKFLKKDDLKDIVSFMKHIKPKASKLIGQSSNFKGKIVEYEKVLKKSKVFKSYNDSFKFFGLKKNFKSKIYFIWWPKDKGPEISFKQNIIFVKMNPLEDISAKINKDELLRLMNESIFYALGHNNKENFEKTVFPSCKKDNFYKILSYVLGPMHLEKITKKKKFDPIKRHFPKSSENIMAILLSNVFETELSNRSKFYGTFQNKIKFICEEVNSSN